MGVGRVLESMLLSPVSVVEIIEALRYLKSKKCPDADCVSTWLIKQCSDDLVESLNILINTSFSKGFSPSKLQNSNSYKRE